MGIEDSYIANRKQPGEDSITSLREKIGMPNFDPFKATPEERAIAMQKLKEFQGEAEPIKVAEATPVTSSSPRAGAAPVTKPSPESLLPPGTFQKSLRTLEENVTGKELPRPPKPVTEERSIKSVGPEILKKAASQIDDAVEILKANDVNRGIKTLAALSIFFAHLNAAAKVAGESVHDSLLSNGVSPDVAATVATVVDVGANFLPAGYGATFKGAEKITEKVISAQQFRKFSAALKSKLAEETGAVKIGSGSDFISAEEAARKETFFKVGKGGAVSRLGPQPDAALASGEAVVGIGPQGRRIVNSKDLGKDTEALAKLSPRLDKLEKDLAPVSKVLDIGQEKTAKAVNEIKQLVDESGGTTYNLVNGNQAGQNKYSVSVPVEGVSKVLDHPASEAELHEFISAAVEKVPQLLTDSRVNLGVGTDKATGKTWLDVSLAVADRDRAMGLARKHDQVSIFHLGEFKEDLAGGTGNLPSPGAYPKFADALHEAYEGPIQSTLQDLKFLGADVRAGLKGTTQLSKSADQNIRLRSLGAASIANGAKDFRSWSSSFLAEFPEQLRGQFTAKSLRELYEASKDEWYRQAKKVVDTYSRDEAFRLNLTEAGTLPRTSHLLDLANKGAFNASWYYGATDEIVKLFGREGADQFANIAAALSAQTAVKPNAEAAVNAFLWHKAGKSFEEIVELGKKLPGDVGAVFSLPARLNNLERALAGKPISGPKVERFAQALKGDKNAVTVDTWMGRIFGIDRLSPGTVQFLESWVRISAREAGVPPRDFQAALWGASKALREGELFADEAIRPIRSEIVNSLKQAVADGKLNVPAGLLDNQDGFIKAGVMWAFARAGAGAIVGSQFGDTTEERITNGLIGMGFGILASPRLVKSVARHLDDVASEKDIIAPLAKPSAKTINESAFAVRASDIKEIANRYADEVQKATRGVVHKEESFKAAEALQASGKISPDTIKAILPGTAFNDAEVSAIINTLAPEGEKLITLARESIANPNDKDILSQMLKQMANFAELDPKRLGAIAESGRSLQILNDPNSATNAFLKQVSELFGEAKGGRDALDLAKLIANLKSQDELILFAKNATKPGFLKVVREVWVNGLLSAIKTHLANMLSNTAHLMWMVPERAVAAGVDLTKATVAGSPRSIRLGEAGAMVHGYIGSIQDAWAMAHKAFTEDASQFGRGKVEERVRAISAEALELSGPVGHAVDLLGSIINTPGKLMLAEDEFFKSIAFRAEARALSYREAYGKVIEEGLTGAKATDRMKEIMSERLADLPASINDAAEKFATYATFTQDLKFNGVGSTIADLSHDHPLLSFIMPFIRTPINIMKAGVERSPIALAVPSMRREILKGGPEGSLAQAKLALGSLTMGAVGLVSLQGIITGSGPQDKALRQNWLNAGWQPNSIKVNGTWYDYSRVTEPIGTIITLAADVAEIASHLTPDDSALEKFYDMVTGVASNLANNFTNKTFTQGLANFMAALSDPDNKMAAFIKSFVRSTVPGAVRQFTLAEEAELKEIRDISTLREVVNAFKSGVPGLASGLPPKRTLFGDPVEFSWGKDGVQGYAWNLVSPINVKYTKDPKAVEVYKEIVRLSYATGENITTETPKEIQGIILTPKERDRLAVIMGKELKPDGRDLKDVLSDTTQLSIYQQSSDEMKSHILRGLIRNYRQIATVLLQQEFPELETAVRDAQINKLSKLAGGQ